VLQDQELKTERYLGVQYRRLTNTYEQIRANRAQRQAFETQLRVRQEQFLAGRGTLDILLEAQRFWADSLSQEQAALVSYTNARSAFAYGKGTILQHAPMPCGGERDRTQDRVLGEPAKGPALAALWKGVPPLRDARPLPPDEARPAVKDAALTPYPAVDLFPRTSR
jgi:hypothetical protein